MGEKKSTRLLKDRGGTRSGVDRRRKHAKLDDIERRTGKDRRSGVDRRKRPGKKRTLNDGTVLERRDFFRNANGKYNK